MNARDAALLTAPVRVKGVVVSLAHGLAELRHADDLDELVDGVADVLRHRLDRDERGLLLMAAAQAAEPDDLEALAWAVAEDTRAGPPVVPVFDDLRGEAKLWASWATPAERKAYMAACWNRLPSRERAAFVKAARKVPA